MVRFAATVAFCALATTASPALGQSNGIPSARQTGPALDFTMRGGVGTRPEFFGADNYVVTPDVGFQLNYLRFGALEIGNPDPDFERRGVGFTGSFRYIGARTSDDAAILNGLDDIDPSVEIGLSLTYTEENFEIFSAVRYGVIGHNAFVGEIGADFIARPTDRLALRAGPRVQFSDDDFSDTYFGISAAEALASGLPAFDATGGLTSVGFEVGMTYRIDDRWGLDGAIGYNELVGDARDSPITRSDASYFARIGITRRFTLGF